MSKITYLDKFVTFRRPTVAEIPALRVAAEADGHALIYPTEIIEKGGNLAGYLSVGVLPTVLLWMDTKTVKAQDSLLVLNYLEIAAARLGAPGLLCPVNDDSPVKPYMQRLGFVDCGKSTLYLKTFNLEDK